jgi:hypothetical protein
MIQKTFISYSELKKFPRVIVVDSYHPKGIVFSHWRGANKNLEINDDTSAGIVINAIKKGLAQLACPYVTSNHFDIDGFIAAWALFNPELALQYEKLLREMALIGDFRELDLDREFSDLALKLVCWINHEEKRLFYPPFGAKEEEVSEAIFCVEKFNYFLKEFEKVIIDPEKFQLSWEDEYKKVLSDYNIVNGDEAKSVLFNNIDLKIVQLPEPVHYYALFSKSQSFDIIVSMYNKNRYEVEYKYTTWIDTAKRLSYPRLDMRPLAEDLNSYEKSGHTWICEPVTDTGPVLRLDTGKLSKKMRYEHPYKRKILSSSLEPDLFRKIITSYFEHRLHNVQRKFFWSWEEIKLFNQDLKQKI